jgi:hypothetical protein
VPRYYFNFCSDETETTDLVGEECRNDTEALKRALLTAGDMLRDQLLFNRVSDGWIEVENSRHQEVMRLPLRAAAY